MDRTAGEPVANPGLRFAPTIAKLRRWMLLGTFFWLGNNLLVDSPVAALDGGAVFGQQSGGYYRHYGRKVAVY